jgi:hypothetical protein
LFVMPRIKNSPVSSLSVVCDDSAIVLLAQTESTAWMRRTSAHYYIL